METPYAPPKLRYRSVWLCAGLLLLAVVGQNSLAQSTDIGFPTPVRADVVAGTIAPRDLGDPRLTRYFYSFTGTPGDLILTVEGRNLEGDVDVFTAGGLRPLAKISLYAGSSSSGGAQTIYLRTRQPLILRVEARTPNDSEGSFRVRFGGAFEPMGQEVPDPEPVIPTVSSEGKGRRVTATGATIEEPAPTPTATTRPEESRPEPAATPTTTTETPATTAKAARPARTGTLRIRRPLRIPRRTTRNRPAPTAEATRPPATEQPAAPTVEPAAGPRLIIETRDGMRIERYMTTVRRVTVERGQIVVVTTDGKVERQPMSNVLRMAIEP